MRGSECREVGIGHQPRNRTCNRSRVLNRQRAALPQVGDQRSLAAEGQLSLRPDLMLLACAID